MLRPENHQTTEPGAQVENIGLSSNINIYS